MMQYVNGFSCAVSKDKSEVVINFVQKVPDVEDDGTVSETTEKVASVIMGRESAKQLTDALAEFLEE